MNRTVQELMDGGTQPISAIEFVMWIAFDQLDQEAAERARAANRNRR